MTPVIRKTKPWTPPKGKIKTAIPVINKPVLSLKNIEFDRTFKIIAICEIPKPIMTRANAAATTFQFSLTRGCFHQILSGSK